MVQKAMIDFEDLYQRYVDDRSDLPIYRSGAEEIGEADLLDRLGADLDNIRCDYGAREDYAGEHDEGTVLEIYSIAEAKELYKERNQRVSL